MPRNRHAKKKYSIPLLVKEPGPKTDKIRIDLTGEMTQDKFVQFLIDSDSLAAEPEFLDLEFDKQKAFEVTTRLFEKNEQLLEAARKKGPEALQAVSEDLRNDIISKLLTPEFRMEINNRLQTLLERLRSENENKKLQMATALETLMRFNDFPLSMSGLVNQIYQRSIQQSLRDQQEEIALIESLTADIGLDGSNPQELFALLDQPEKLNPLENELFKNPGLKQRLEDQVAGIMDDFETELKEGRVELDLFTGDELIFFINRIEQRITTEAQILERSDPVAKELVVKMFNGVVGEILPPERWQSFYRDVQNVARKWISDRYTWGAAMQAELGLLAKEEYQPNPFVVFVLLGQLKRMGEPKKVKRSRK